MRVSRRRRIGKARRAPGVRAWNVLTARVNVLRETGATPDDHLCSGPNCRVTFSTIGWTEVAGSDPCVGDGIVSPANGWKAKILVFPTPDDHLTRGPHGRVKISRRRRVYGARGRPTIRDGIVSPTGAQLVGIGVFSTPDDHLAASPDSGVEVSGIGGVGAGSGPNVRDRIVSAACVHETKLADSTPYDHFRPSPDRRVKASG